MKASNLKFIFALTVLLCWNTNSNAQNSKMQVEIKKINELHKPTYAKRDSLAFFYKVFYEKIESTRDTVIKNQLKVKILELDKVTDANNKKELLNEFGFIRQYPSCPISLDILHAKITRRESTDHLETFTNLCNSLSPDLKSSPKGFDLMEMLHNFTNSSVGKNAPEFTLKEKSNKTVSLKNFEGKKYVLLNFWVSTYQPCIDDISFLKEINEKYKSQDLEIISIALDDDVEVWRKAIDNQKLEVLTNVSSIINNSYIEGLYFVTSIPQKVLIDKEGKIIARWRGAEKENHKEIIKELNLLLNRKSTIVSKMP